MRATPVVSTWGDHPEPRIISTRSTEPLWIDCLIIAPKSSKGRSVDVMIPVEVEERLFLVLKARMIARRSIPEGQRSEPSALDKALSSELPKEESLDEILKVREEYL